MTLRALIVMAKEPSPGETKTRLTPPLTPQQAADLYECLLRDTIEGVREALSVLPITPFIAYHPAGSEPYFRDLAPDFQLIPQRGLNLGQNSACLFYANTFRELSLEAIHQNRQQLSNIFS